MLSLDYFLKLLAPLVSAITIVVLTLIERKDKSLLYCWGAGILAIILFIVTSITTYKDHKSTIEIDQQRTQMTTMMQKSLALQGDDEFLRNFVELQRIAINRIASNDSAKFVDTLFNNIDEKREGREKLSKASKKIAATYTVQWQPVYDQIVSHFDHRMELLKKEGYIKEIEINDIQIICIESKRVDKVTRQYTFSDNTSITIHVHPALVELGKFTEIFHLGVNYYGKAKNTQFFSIALSENECEIGGVFKLVDFKKYKTKENPMSDDIFMETISDNIDKAITYCVVESQFFKK